MQRFSFPVGLTGGFRCEAFASASIVSVRLMSTSRGQTSQVAKMVMPTRSLTSRTAATMAMHPAAMAMAMQVRHQSGGPYYPGQGGGQPPQQYYPQQGGGQQSQAPQYQYPPQGGQYYPPPPPPPMPSQQDGRSGGLEMGSKERPLFVQPMATRTSAITKVWFLLIIIIAGTQLYHLFEEWDFRGGGEGKSGGGGMMGGSSRMAGMMGGQGSDIQAVDLDDQTTTFDEVQGCDEAKQELQEMVMFLKDPKKFIDIGGRLPRGALLVGPPGCGKTMLAKAIAKEANVKFYYATGSEFDEVFVGVGSRRVRELFAEAKKNSPALIFIDEIDSLGAKRSSRDAAYSRMTLNQLLAEMDGFNGNDEVVVIAATNTPDTLDKALTRPGRFDTSISVDPPDLRGREAIVGTYLDKIKKDSSVSALDIAQGTTGMTGAELRNLVNVAAIRAAVLDKKEVSQEHVEYAKDRVMMGAENRSKVVPDYEKRITAFHEGGHALVALLLEEQGADPVHKATIVPRGSGIMGLVMQQPKADRYSMSRKQIMARLQVCLGGRVAEEILLGTDDVTTGASSDFQQATNLARGMVRQYGFGEGLGVVDYQNADTAEGAYTSDATKEKIEIEVRRIVGNTYEDTMKLLTTNRDTLDKLAHSLLLHETLSGDELKSIVAGNTLAPPKPRERPTFGCTSKAAEAKKGGGGGSIALPAGGNVEDAAAV